MHLTFSNQTVINVPRLLISHLLKKFIYDCFEIKIGIYHAYETKPSISETMAKLSKPQASSDEAMSNDSNSSEEEQVNDQINEEEDDEELEAVARSSSDDDDEEAAAAGDLPPSDEDVADADNGGAEEVNSLSGLFLVGSGARLGVVWYGLLCMNLTV